MGRTHRLLLASLLALFGFGCGAEALEPWQRHTIDASGVNADGVRLADVNGDGLPDIATPWTLSGAVRIYFNPGPERVYEPWPAVTVGEVEKAEDAVFADLDGDGDYEVVSSSENEVQTIHVHEAMGGDVADPASWTTRPLTGSHGHWWMFALPLDVDGDGVSELISGSKNEGGAIGVWRFPPEGEASFERWYDAGWVMSLRAHDMDGDGLLDLVASDRMGAGRGVLWFRNSPESPENKNAVWPVTRIGPVDEYEAMFLDIADLDDDGNTDIVLAVKGGPIRFLKNLGGAGDDWSVSEIAMPEGFGTGKAVRVGDMDLDGVPDIVFTCEHADGELSGVGLLRHAGDPTASDWEVTDIGGPEGIKYDRIELLDLDGDGDLDILTTEQNENLGVIWYENPTR